MLFEGEIRDGQFVLFDVVAVCMHMESNLFTWKVLENLFRLLAVENPDYSSHEGNKEYSLQVSNILS